MTRVLIPVQERNALQPIEVTLALIEISVILEQSLKAREPIVFTREPITSDLIPLQPSKALFPIDVIFGSKMVVRSVILEQP
jgi:hypothetical protein